MLTYGDGLSNVNIKKLYDFHKKHNKFATLTAVQPTGKFGSILIKDECIKSFQEKPKGDGSWINGGFFVLEPKIFEYIENDNSVIWERGPLERLANENQLMAFQHDGFWSPMDTLRDKIELENIWNAENCPWKLWK